MFMYQKAPNATKIWLTRTGGCIVASNGSQIASKELNELMEFISAQFFLICVPYLCKMETVFCYKYD